MDRSRPTQVGRLPQESRLRGIVDLERANEFLRSEYTDEFHSRFAVPAAQKGTAFVRAQRQDLDRVFCTQHERTAGNDNTVSLDNRVLRLNKAHWRGTLAGQSVAARGHLGGRISIRCDPHVIAQYARHELPWQAPRKRGTLRPGGIRKAA